jgi:hypothetical protein
MRFICLGLAQQVNSKKTVSLLLLKNKGQAGQRFSILYSSVLYCTVLYCTVLYCTVLYCTVLYCTVAVVG